ncbi:HAMP domain-containing sensor histidine kinase [Halobacteriovorax sp. GB3]|uniref:sensor histidine kinase n=1 Tax=Halobacteriovorax sp. GB3 TaxID=2719615 RepID=UPI0023629580|nr:HAMP domain-containing sensor histidine kinase [Halobacteriovorax sp. GB3]MDD0851507.1 HAMP domain-containing sensor histidine kinase [Halobacteriovorax sp. GB3]
MKRNSLFFKIFFTLSITSVLILVGAFSFIKFFYLPEHLEMQKKVQEINIVAPLIEKEMIFPINQEKLEAVANKYNVRIRVQKNKTTWSSHFKIPDMYHLKRALRRAKRDNTPLFFKEMKIKGHRLFILPQDLPFKKPIHLRKSPLFIFSIFTITILAMSFLVLRKILGPIAILSNAVERVSKGDLQHKIDPLDIDEFNYLANAFNNMLDTIHGMIEARNQLLTDVAHELRTPLTRMKLTLEFMEDTQEKESLNEEIEELKYIIDTILETERLSNSDLLKKESISLDQLFSDLKEKFSNLEIPSKSTDTKVNLDKEKITLVLKNLIENAYKYNQSTGPVVGIEASIKKSSLEIIVYDNGQGFEEEQLERVFEPFYRIDKSRNKKIEGYGFGLYMCKKIVKAHKGKIKIESEIHVGSKIKISLPLGG